MFFSKTKDIETFEINKIYLLKNIQNEIFNEGETQNRKTALLSDLSETEETSSEELGEDDEINSITNERKLVKTQ
jgi:hypothetical protein